MNATQTDGGTPVDSALSTPDRLLAKVENFLDLMAAFFILFLMFFGTSQIVARKVFNYPLWGYIDIVEITMATFAFLGVAYSQRLGGHIRMEILIRQLHGRMLWVVEALGALVGLAIILVLLWYGYEHFLRAFQLGDSTIDREISIWPSKMLVPIAFSVLALRLGLQVLGYLRLARRPDVKPVAVPVIEEFEELARHEIEEAMGQDAGGEDEGG